MGDDSKLPPWVEAARSTWIWRGARRPPFAIPPGPGQESVWDYPRPPVLVPERRRVEVRFEGIQIASTSSALRLLETSHPPTFYLPLAGVDTSRLIPVVGGSFCEWKGQAVYFDLSLGGRRLPRAAWAYPEPIEENFQDLAHRVAFYATHLDCLVEGAQARPQAGGFYGGWITPELTGPFKGDPSTGGWLRRRERRATFGPPWKPGPWLPRVQTSSTEAWTGTARGLPLLSMVGPRGGCSGQVFLSRTETMRSGRTRRRRAPELV
jgi:uncharacterized protein (DUF427 family)